MERNLFNGMLSSQWNWHPHYADTFFGITFFIFSGWIYMNGIYAAMIYLGRWLHQKYNINFVAYPLVSSLLLIVPFSLVGLFLITGDTRMGELVRMIENFIFPIILLALYWKRLRPIDLKKQRIVFVVPIVLHLFNLVVGFGLGITINYIPITAVAVLHFAFLYFLYAKTKHAHHTKSINIKNRNRYSTLLWVLIVTHLVFTIVATALGVRLPIPGTTVILLLFLIVTHGLHQYSLTMFIVFAAIAFVMSNFKRISASLRVFCSVIINMRIRLARNCSTFLGWLPCPISRWVILRSALDRSFSESIGRNWIWEEGGTYFGVPFSNYIGWLLCVFTFFQLFALYVAWHPDRLARNSVDGGQIIYLIDGQKVSALRFPTFWFEPTPQGLFMLQVAFGQSKYYSDNLSENVKRGIRQKLRRGEWIGKAPLGYVNNRQTRNIEPDPVKSKIVQKAFKDFANGNESVETLRYRLSFYGIVNGKGRALAKSSVYWILKNPLYAGLIKYKGEMYKGNFEPLLTTELFEAVQDRLSENSRPRKSKHAHNFPFTELLKCGECGSMITAQYAKGNGGVYAYYRCTKKKGHCGQSYLRDDLILEELRSLIKNVALPQAWKPMISERLEQWEGEERRELQSFAQNLETKITNTQEKLDKLVSAFLNGIVDRSTYLNKKEELIKQKIELEQQRKNFGQKAKLWVEPMRDWLEMAHNAGKLAFSNDFEEIKIFLDKVGSNLYLKDKKVAVDFVRPWDILLHYKALEGSGVAGGGTKKEGKEGKNPTFPVAW